MEGEIRGRIGDVSSVVEGRRRTSRQAPWRLEGCVWLGRHAVLELLHGLSSNVDIQFVPLRSALSSGQDTKAQREKERERRA